MPLDEPRVTTTHTDPAGPVAGAPHLVLKSEVAWAGEQQRVFWLDRTRTTIGSHDSCDVVLPDLEALHAVVFRDDADEFLLERRAPDTRVHGAVVMTTATLRTGARIELGPHSFAYSREEHADHGRPFGGREGGEVGHQRSQPPRRSQAEQDAGR
ncbi:MAG: FHA domain-containing protein [Ornithinibacter sp.]